jgi:hypothetical protein
MKDQGKQNIRFTTLVNPHLLSQLKLVSYFTNIKVYEMVNKCIQLGVEDFETQYNTKIDSLIKLQQQTTKVEEQPTTPPKEESKK